MATAHDLSVGKQARLEQFQEKCETVFRPELRQNKEIGVVNNIVFRDCKYNAIA
ncbi:hypothetical protein [Mesorhizobium amorphae]|uniref:Uncharacterized protein n=1 Tax=Mesorhizobium amorphae CCNWGS0123 TaxID=1082933 RepID=G6Y5J4_9HYPH|nr:hypothetical protein [Mesorhizobium amorphae]EHH13034.1 hypothetical protein MEA186_06016 [Mesorhizobium amorphae CCNWGS0123]GLR40650.1 hypothetical protein GCM10007880_11660 [Mesorhizobium amorphae]